MRQPLLLEIGCEEIPARMIGAGAEDLRLRVLAVLDQAGIEHGDARAWGGARRLAVRVEEVSETLPGKDQLVLGPPASAAFRDDGTPTPAGAGFAKKQGIDPGALQKIETEKGLYAGFRRTVAERTLADVLAAALPPSIAAMTFPKMMRWGTGTHRFVRPVHWVVALHGGDVIDLEVLGAKSGRYSDGHRFLAPGPVPIEHADRYIDALRAARVLVEPEERRAMIVEKLIAAAAELGGRLELDEALLDEVVELVEWPSVIAGRFDASFLELPEVIRATTLRHHQKAFSVRGQQALLPAFLSVANTDGDRAGHVKRGNEWVVVGRLEDARYFWSEDRKRPLASRVDDLKRVAFHKTLGNYEEKTRRVTALADAITDKLGAALTDARFVESVTQVAQLCKADLVTGLVGEFPELQGIVGGLLFEKEGGDRRVATAISEHYKPTGADDSIPSSGEGRVVAIADRLDTMVGLIGAGETPTGSRDPFGLRRAASGVFRILAESGWPLTLTDLVHWAGSDQKFEVFLNERMNNWLIDRGYSANEIEAVRRPMVSLTPSDFDQWPIAEILSRLEIVATLRGRSDFAKLVELTKRVDNILAKQPEVLEPAITGDKSFSYKETDASALALQQAHDSLRPRILAASAARDFPTVIDHLAALVAPVAKFFDDVLVLDPANPAATFWRCELLDKVRSTITRDFDIRELAGQADANR